jgi:hypothetical protein
MKSISNVLESRLEEFHYYQYSLTNRTLCERNKLGVMMKLNWNEQSKRFESIQKHHVDSIFNTLIGFLKDCLLPSGKLYNDYYTYIKWRLAQRFISATNSVFGSQALLLALGYKSNKIGSYN